MDELHRQGDGPHDGDFQPGRSPVRPGIYAALWLEGSYGPAGDRYYQLRVGTGLMTSAGVGGIGLWFDGEGTSGGNDAVSDTLWTDSGGQIAMRRSGIQGVTNGSSGCVVWLYSLASSQTISIETFEGQLLSVTPSAVAVRKGTPVSFRATSGGVLVSAPHWRFDGDSGITNETGACGLSGPNPCLVTVQNSGTLRVSKYISGRMRATSARVRVYSSFTLDADQTELVAGDTVTFTPKLDGVTGPAARWLWRGDDSTVVAGPCAPGTDTCLLAPFASGTMWAYTADTGGDSASKHVTVIPCPTGDTLLDNLTFRHTIKLVWDSSFAADTSKRVERMGVMVYDTLLKKYASILLPLNSVPYKNTPCEVNPGTWALPANSVVVTYVHSHPFADSASYSGLCPKDAQGQYQTYVPRSMTGWGSGLDWHVSDNLNLPSYIIDSLKVIRLVGDSADVHPLYDINGNIYDYYANKWSSAQTVHPRSPQCTYMAVTTVSLGQFIYAQSSALEADSPRMRRSGVRVYAEASRGGQGSNSDARSQVRDRSRPQNRPFNAEMMRNRAAETFTFAEEHYAK